MSTENEERRSRPTTIPNGAPVLNVPDRRQDLYGSSAAGGTSTDETVGVASQQRPLGISTNPSTSPIIDGISFNGIPTQFPPPSQTATGNPVGTNAAPSNLLLPTGGQNYAAAAVPLPANTHVPLGGNATPDQSKRKRPDSEARNSPAKRKVTPAWSPQLGIQSVPAGTPTNSAQALTALATAASDPEMDQPPKRKRWLCRVPGCPRKMATKGYCKPHRLDPNMVVENPINDEDAELERYTGPQKRGPKVKKKPEQKKRPDPFLTFYPELVRYKQEHGNLRVPKSEKELYRFIEATRTKYVATTQQGKTSRILTQERIDQLNELDFEWTPTANDEGWEESFRLLLEFHSEHGHCRVNTKADSSLSNFVRKMRSAYAQQMNAMEKGTLSTERTRILTLERIERLNSIGFEWRMWTQDPWEKRFQDIQDYKQKNGDFGVKMSEDQTLSSWVKTQRTGYRNFMNMLRADNERKMAARHSNGVTPPDLDAVYDACSKKRPMLDAERIVKLQMIGFEWTLQETMYEDAWERSFMQLLQFKADHGHTRVSRNYTENPQLGTWVKMQRRAMTKKIKGTGGHSLSDERIRRLDDIGFEWRLKPLEMD